MCQFYIESEGTKPKKMYVSPPIYILLLLLLIVINREAAPA
jgi:hypothetical protein